MTTLLAALPGAVRALGEPGFERALLEALHAATGAAHLAVIAFDRRLLPQLVAAESRGGATLARSAGRSYFGGLFYRHDPTRGALARQPAGAAGDAPLLLRLAARDIRDRAWRQQIYERYGLAERLSLLGLAGHRWLTLNLYRGAADGAFADAQVQVLQDAASVKLNVEQRDQELRVFAYRLMLTLPLLVVAGWLFAKKRQSTWWPFVWGFIYFALFAFFVELVPYLPSYGGYVRYVVGIVITVLVGRYAIIALNRYLEKQKQAEAMPDVERRKELSYDTALARLAKKVCPGCERPVDLTNTAIDYCPHCGICLFDHCGMCNERKSAFSRFCHACGVVAGQGTAD